MNDSEYPAIQALGDNREMFEQVYRKIDSAETLSELESIITALDQHRLTGKLLFCVGIYIIDNQKLYRQADCRSISALARKHKTVFDGSRSQLSNDRKIGEGFYRNRYWLWEHNIQPNDLRRRVSHLAHLSEARANKSDDEVISAFNSMSYERFKSFASSPYRKISGSAKVPTVLSKERFERELYPLIESRGTPEQRKLVDDVYQRDEASGQYRLDKSVSRADRDRIVDTMYCVGYRNPALYNLENPMAVGVHTKITDLPMGQRTPKILFPDDQDVPPREVREAVLKEVRKQILKAGAEHK